MGLSSGSLTSESTVELTLLGGWRILPHRAYTKAVGNRPHQAITAQRFTSWATLNTIESAFSLLKRRIMGPWHKISAKHLAAYLDEMTFRFNNWKNPFLLLDTMMKLIHSGNVEYKDLTKAAWNPTLVARRIHKKHLLRHPRCQDRKPLYPY
jgi:hypothetical protein